MSSLRTSSSILRSPGRKLLNPNFSNEKFARSAATSRQGGTSPAAAVARGSTARLTGRLAGKFCKMNAKFGLKNKELSELYCSYRKEIINRISQFESIRKRLDRPRIFEEFLFCLLTPQSKAESCWKGICELKEKGLLSGGEAGPISQCLRKLVRFHNNKSKYIVEARQKFPLFMEILRKEKDVFRLREWLVRNIKGMGYKEASHFLRNIGMGEEIAILDRHIFKNLKALDMIRDIPSSITPEKYFEIEKKMRAFSRRIDIPLAHLDLLFWAREAGKVFK